MNVKGDFQNLLSKEMDRRDFLKHVGVGFVALTGVATLVKTMGGFSAGKRVGGYGGSAYGGSQSLKPRS